jgi:hypothetical protein
MRQKPVALFEIGRAGVGPRLLLTGPPDDPAAASIAAFWKAWREGLIEEELLPIPIWEEDHRRILSILGTSARVAGVALGQRLGMFLIHPPETSAEEALRYVEAEAVRRGLGPLPAAWAAPFLWLKGLELPPDVSETELLMVGWAIRGLCLLLRHHPGPNAPRRPERQTKLLRRMETRRLFPSLWTAPGEDDPPLIIGQIPMGGVDAALAWIEAGQALWRPEEIPEAHPSLPGFVAAANLAEAAGGAGEGLLSWKVWDWPLWWELVRAWRAGRPLPPSDWGSPQVLPLRRGLVERSEVVLRGEGDETSRLAAGLFRALMEVAAQEARYVPQGRLRVRTEGLPPLQARGVAAFRVAADPFGLWLRPVSSEGLEGEIFRLDRELPPRPDLAEVDPFWLAAAAALWHDLVVGAPRPASAARRRVAQLDQGREGEAGEILPSRPPQETLWKLPRSFRVATGEETVEPEVAWGNPEDLRRWSRTAHAVRGHLRRLPAGWKARPKTLRLAEGFGIVVPAGYTFVRPHYRGGRVALEKPEALPEIPAVARGLASLMLLEEGGSR